MNYLSKILILVSFVLFVSCSTSQPTAADKMRVGANLKLDLADMWEDGDKMITNGEKLVSDGDKDKQKAIKMKEEAEKLLKQSETKIQEGNKMISEGTSLKMQSETEYMKRYPGKRLD